MKCAFSAASSASASGRIVEKCIKNRKACLVMSVGGLLGREILLKKAAEKGVKIYKKIKIGEGVNAVK